MSSDRQFLTSLEQIGIKLGLEQIRGLLAELGHPDRAYPSIIIAGTNGKGSATAMLERGLRAAGLRTGRYTSPHLVHLEERFAIDGAVVAAEALDEALARVRKASGALPAPPSFFEATTAAALEIFRTARVDVAVLEVGMGGRLDATNAVDAVASVITSIALDHQQYLGNTIEAISFEKAGVIKPHTFCVLAPNPDVVRTVVARRCADVGADLIQADDSEATTVEMLDGHARVSLHTPVRHYAPLTLGLRGRHQVVNAVTAVRLLEEADRRGSFRVPEAAVRAAVEEVEWPGRLELGRVDSHLVLIDGAHNAAGAEALASYLRGTYPRPMPLVLGVLRDKDVAAIVAPLIRVVSRVVCTEVSSPRAFPAAELAQMVCGLAPHLEVSICVPPREAIAAAADFGSPVVVAGSLYLAGDVRAHLS